MFYLRSILLALLLVIFPTLISCSWSATQQDILNSYNDASEYINRKEWEAAAASLSSATILLLDSLASDLQIKGLYGYESGLDLLPILCREYIDFSGDVTMIFVQGDQAGITLSSAESRSYLMILEEGYWKLSLDGLFRNSINDALTGSNAGLLSDTSNP
ncbi:MAG: hypothetical protein ABFR50_07045 [Candidatus Fermentibacteria bacterium]